MSTAALLSPAIRVSPVPDHRPPAVSDLPARCYRRRGQQPPAPLVAPTEAVQLPVSWDSRRDLPEPGEWLRTLLLAVLESMQGQRNPAPLNRWVAPDIARQVARRHAVALRRRVPMGQVILGPAHLTEVFDGVIEAALVAQSGGRCRAVAVRLEAFRDRWVITALELG